MNILFLGGGRRVTLAEHFIKYGCKVYGYELDTQCPLATVAERIFNGLEWDEHPTIVEELEYIIERNNINMVIPLQDKAVTVASKLNKSLFLPSMTPFPFTSTATICSNKKMFEIFMLNNFPNNYPYEEWNLYDNLNYLAKPIYGFGSKGILEFKNETLNLVKKNVNLDDYIIQRKIVGSEYSVDCFFDSFGKFVDGVPRKRLRVFDGEVISSITEYNEVLFDLSRQIGESLGLVGTSNLQFVIDEEDETPYCIEVNARFGGGCTLSIAAGLDVVALTLSVFGGNSGGLKDSEGVRKTITKYNSSSQRQWKAGVILERAFRDFFFEEND